MTNNLDKKVNRDAKKAFNTVFNITGALIGLALGGKPSTRISRPSGIKRRRPKKW